MIPDTLLTKLASEHGTPLYVYSEGEVARRYEDYSEAASSTYQKSRVFYAMKANSSLAILSKLAELGAGVDCVSGGEVETALHAGFKAQDIIFTSNAKTDEELKLALARKVCITHGNIEELEVLGELAAAEKKRARVSFRINPDVSASTHPKIATGLRDTKFGLHIEGDIAFGAYEIAGKLDGVSVEGVHAHIGSQILETSGFVEAAEKIFKFAARLKDELGIKLKFIDLGGGLGIPYKEEDEELSPAQLMKDLAPAIKDGVKALGYEPTLIFEPGRYIVGPAGVLLTRVLSTKETPARNFVNVDAGFNTLARPAMYDAYHRVTVAGKDGKHGVYDVAGNVCESGDILARERALPKVERGDVLVFHDAGAYGMSMASEYNSRPLPAEVMVRENGEAELIRERGTVKELWKKQRKG